MAGGIRCDSDGMLSMVESASSALTSPNSLEPWEESWEETGELSPDEAIAVEFDALSIDQSNVKQICTPKVNE